MACIDFTNLTSLLAKSPVSTLRHLGKRLEEDGHGLWQLGVLLDIAEFCIKFRAIYAVSEFLKWECGHPAQALGSNRGFDLPSLGDWVNVLRERSEDLRNAGRVRVVDNRLLFDPKQGTYIDEIVGARNRRAHGATLQSEEATEIVRSLMEHVAILATPMCGGGWEIDDELLDSNWAWVVLRDPGLGEDLRLAPFIVQKCSAAGPLLYIFNRDNQKKDAPGSLEYLDYGSGEEFDLWRPPSKALQCRVQGALRRFNLASNARMGQQEFVDDHLQHFVGRHSQIEEVERFIEESSKEAMLVSASPGFGKTGLLAKCANDLKVIYHFATGTDEATIARGAILKNLRSKMRLGAGDSQTSDPTRSSNVSEPKVIVLDGLDEIKDVTALLRELREAEDFRGYRFIFGGQPHVKEPVYKAFGEENVASLQFDGLSLAETRQLAESYEIRNLNDSALGDLHAKTQGMPLYLRTLFANRPSGKLPSSEIANLPQAVEEYWKRLLSRHAPAGANEDVYLRRRMERVENLCRSALAKVLKKCVDEPTRQKQIVEAVCVELNYRLQRELPTVLAILATSPVSLTVAQLSEIMWGCHEGEVLAILKKADSLVSLFGEAKRVRLYHDSFRRFVLKEFQSVMAEVRDMLLEWSEGWKGDGDRAKVRVNLLARQHGAGSALVREMLASWDFFNLYLKAWGVEEATQVYEANTSPSSLGAELRNSIQPLSAKLRDGLEAIRTWDGSKPEIQRGGARVVADFHKRKAKEEEAEELERSLSKYRPEVDEAEEFAGLLAYQKKQDEKEAEFNARPLPDLWFGDWADCKKAMEEIRSGFNQAVEGVEHTKAPPREFRLAWLLSDLLRRCRHQLSESEADVALVAYNSGILRGTNLDRTLAKQIFSRQSIWIQRLHRRPGAAFAGAEVLHKEIGDTFCVSAGSSLVIHTREGSDLICEDWLNSEAPKRELISTKKGQRISVLRLSYDGRMALVSISTRESKRRVLIDTQNGAEIREVPLSEGRQKTRLLDATPDLKTLLVDRDGEGFVLDSWTGKACNLETSNLKSNQRGLLSMDGRIAIFRSTYGHYFARDLATMQNLYPIPSVNGDKTAHFQIDPAGEFYVERSCLYSVSEGLRVRTFFREGREGKIRRQYMEQLCAAFSMDSRILVIGDQTGLFVFDVQDGKQIGQIPLREPGRDLILSSDGRFALVTSQLDHLLVVDLRNSRIERKSPISRSDCDEIPSSSPRGVAYFWDEAESTFCQVQVQKARVGCQKRRCDDPSLQRWCPRTSSLLQFNPACRNGEIILFADRERLRLFVFNLEGRSRAKELDLLNRGKAKELRKHLAVDLRLLREEYRLRDRPMYRPAIHCGGPIPINDTLAGIRLTPNILAIVDVTKMRVVQWRQWAPALDRPIVDGMFASGDSVFLVTSGHEVIIWNWREGLAPERHAPDGGFSSYIVTVSGVCAGHLVIGYWDRGPTTLVSLFNVAERRFSQISINMPGYFANDLRVVNGTQYILACLYEVSSNFSVGRRLGLIDIHSGDVVASYGFESPIRKIFELDCRVFGIVLEDGTLDSSSFPDWNRQKPPKTHLHNINTNRALSCVFLRVLACCCLCNTLIRRHLSGLGNLRSIR